MDLGRNFAGVAGAAAVVAASTLTIPASEASASVTDHSIVVDLRVDDTGRIGGLEVGDVLRVSFDVDPYNGEGTGDSTSFFSSGTILGGNGIFYEEPFGNPDFSFLSGIVVAGNSADDDGVDTLNLIVGSGDFDDERLSIGPLTNLDILFRGGADTFSDLDGNGVLDAWEVINSESMDAFNSDLDEFGSSFDAEINNGVANFTGSVTSVRYIVPSPGTLALLGLAGAFAFRRRRGGSEATNDNNTDVASQDVDDVPVFEV